MSNQRMVVCLSSFLLFAGLVCGCGSGNKIVSGGMPGASAPGETPAGAKPRQTALNNYTVRRHDCLWAIAGKPDIYGDPFEWPLLFKANRGEIKDPDLIYPRQDLKVQKGLSLEEKTHADQVALATPRYVPHSKPRETLPVDYF